MLSFDKNTSSRVKRQEMRGNTHKIFGFLFFFVRGGKKKGEGVKRGGY